jgi:cytochrome c-type biogenesis protein CcmE
LLKRKKKFLIGGAVLLVAVGYLAFVGFKGSATYYYTVSEYVAQGSSIDGKIVRLNGQVVPGSVEQKPADLTLKFTIAESGQSLPVTYRGVVPDTFRPGGDIVIEGSLDSGGIFRAKTLMPKCPSKYLPTG